MTSIEFSIYIEVSDIMGRNPSFVVLFNLTLYIRNL